MSGPAVRTLVKRQSSDPSEPSSPGSPPKSRSPRYGSPKFNGWRHEEVKRCRASFQTPSKKFKGDSRYTGSDNEDDDFNDSNDKGFIQYN